MTTKELLKSRIKYIGINLILFAILYFSVSMNKNIVRPVIGNSAFLSIITGSFPNFMAVYLLSLTPIYPVLSKRLDVRNSRKIIYMVTFIVFMILTIEEIRPFVGASETYDLFDIVANGIGSICAILTFEVVIKTKFINLN